MFPRLSAALSFALLAGRWAAGPVSNAVLVEMIE